MLSKAFVPFLGVLGVSAGGGYLLQQPTGVLLGGPSSDDEQLLGPVPTRAQALSRLQNSTRDNPFDVLIIGGGATGTGCAVDATTRGLRTALVEREDFASGTSSRSTKLVHGGVRYLEKAVFNLDYGQLKLVYEALHERRNLLENAPHLAHTLPILMPCYKWWEVPFYWSGLKFYDLVAGTSNVGWSKYLPCSESERRLPTLAESRSSDARSLKGTILYYDGQFDDARLNVTLACTAAAAGGAITNYVEAQQLIKNPDGKVIGARCKDRQSGDSVDVFARTIINATGPFVDSVRQMGDKTRSNIVMPSSGAHVTLPEYYGSTSTGMIVPKTKDGRVVFMLPWHGHVIAGTTDAQCEVTTRPQPSEKEIAFILDAISEYLAIKVRREDVLSAWSGIRPLAAAPSTPGGTASISRDHVIFEDPDGMITVTGGKWTTYRLMAQDTVDRAVGSGRLPMARPCSTAGLKLVGARGYTNTTHAEVAQSSSSLLGTCGSVSPAVARHLAAAYGDKAYDVLRLAAADKGLAAPLVADHPYLEAEVLHCCRHEFCTTVEDFIARRTRLAFLDTRAAAATVPRVAELMAAELGWSSGKRRQEVERAMVFLKTFCSLTL